LLGKDENISRKRGGSSDNGIAGMRHHMRVPNESPSARLIQKCLRFGVQAALGELPRSGKPRRVSDAAIA
jgi:hypothetical protein